MIVRRSSSEVFFESLVITTLGIVLALCIYLPTVGVVTWGDFVAWCNNGRWFAFALTQIITPTVRTIYERMKGNTQN